MPLLALTLLRDSQVYSSHCCVDWNSTIQYSLKLFALLCNSRPESTSDCWHLSLRTLKTSTSRLRAFDILNFVIHFNISGLAASYHKCSVGCTTAHIHHLWTVMVEEDGLSWHHHLTTFTVNTGGVLSSIPHQFSRSRSFSLLLYVSIQQSFLVLTAHGGSLVK